MLNVIVRRYCQEKGRLKSRPQCFLTSFVCVLQFHPCVSTMLCSFSKQIGVMVYFSTSSVQLSYHDFCYSQDSQKSSSVVLGHFFAFPDPTSFKLIYCLDWAFHLCFSFPLEMFWALFPYTIFYYFLCSDRGT